MGRPNATTVWQPGNERLAGKLQGAGFARLSLVRAAVRCSEPSHKKVVRPQRSFGQE
jgi:hypothetical protein